MTNFDEGISERSTGFVSAARVLVGLFLLGLGVATFFAGDFRSVLMAQLSAANVPFQSLTLSVIPSIEGVAGVMLLGGFMVRLASLVGVVISLYLTFLDIVVTSPTLLPLQFGLPLIPIVALVLSGFLYVVDRYEED